MRDAPRDVALLNSSAKDFRGANAIVDHLRASLASAEAHLLGSTLPDYASYRAAQSQVAALRNMLADAEKIFARHFNV